MTNELKSQYSSGLGNEFEAWIEGILRDVKHRENRLTQIKQHLVEILDLQQGKFPNQYLLPKAAAEAKQLAEYHLVLAEKRAGIYQPVPIPPPAPVTVRSLPSTENNYSTSRPRAIDSTIPERPVIARTVPGPAVNTKERVIPPGCEYIFADLKREKSNVRRFPFFGWFFVWMDRIKAKHIDALCQSAVKKTLAEQSVTDAVNAGTIQEATRAVQVAGLANTVAASSATTTRSEADVAVTIARTDAEVARTVARTDAEIAAYGRIETFGVGAISGASPHSIPPVTLDLGLPVLNADQKEKKEAELAHMVADYGHEPTPDNEMAVRDGVFDTVGNHPFDSKEIGEGTHGMLANLANSQQDGDDLDETDETGDSDAAKGKA